MNEFLHIFTVNTASADQTELVNCDIIKQFKIPKYIFKHPKIYNRLRALGIEYNNIKLLTAGKFLEADCY